MDKKKIVVTKDLKFYEDQKKRLELLGDVTYYDDEPKSPDEWLERCQGADIICTGLLGFTSDRVYTLKDVFISVPVVGVEFLDKKKLKESNIVVSNSPGCNKEAVAEWMMGMMLMHFRRLCLLTRSTDIERKEALSTDKGLFNRTITILGSGNIARQLAKICEVFDMKVSFFKRGDDLLKSVRDADIVANCLSTNESTTGLLDKKFFSSLKPGSFFISISKSQVYDIEALKSALDEDILIGAADDAAAANIGDVKDPEYLKLLNHPKILVTPHIAWNSEIEIRKSNDIMIDNIEAWLKGKPINLIK